MLQKGGLFVFFLLVLQGCDSDFKQGRCEEGFFEQTDGNGGTFCVPINDEGARDQRNSE